MDPNRADLEPVRRRGRRVGIGVFSLLVTAFTAICSVQVLAQVWAPNVVPTDKPCHVALRGLMSAIERARAEAALETRGERAAVQRFRRSLDPEWSHRAALDGTCQDEEHRRALVLIDWLRYAEEHAVRYEALDVAQLRREASSLMERLQARHVGQQQ
jgi:hypothetical protein